MDIGDEESEKNLGEKSMIKMIIFDIDGVLTDGMVIVNSDGKEQKKINLRDIDAIYDLKSRGYLLAAITGENTEIVSYFKDRFPWDYFIQGEKNKIKGVQNLEVRSGLRQNEIMYIGDGKYDIDALSYAGVGVCPSNAANGAKAVADFVLQHAGGQGCSEEVAELVERLNVNHDEIRVFLDNRIEEHVALFKQMMIDDFFVMQIKKCAQLMLKVFQNGGKIFLCGNGGSAADAQHIAAEFVSRFYYERHGLNAEALTVNTSILTAIGNDYGYDQIFSRQLEAKAKTGDLLIGISTSGTSKNILTALNYAMEQNIYTVFFTGDIELDEIISGLDCLIRVPSIDVPRVQEVHIFLGHLLAEYVEYQMFVKNK